MNETSTNYAEYVFIYKGFGFKKIAIMEITYLEAARNYCDIHLSDGSCMSVSVPMNEVHEYLSPSLFKRIHRSYTINLEHVDSYTGNTIKLRNGNTIAIGRKYRENIKNEFVCIGSRKRIRENNTDK